jgi:hypothetical protein
MGTQDPGYRVLLLYSESRLTPSVVSADQALRSTLEARLSRPVHFYTEFLDLNSFHGASLQRNLRELVGLKYRERWIDLIVAQGQLVWTGSPPRWRSVRAVPARGSCSSPCMTIPIWRNEGTPPVRSPMC